MKLLLLAQSFAFGIYASPYSSIPVHRYSNETSCSENQSSVQFNKTTSLRQLEKLEELAQGRIPDTYLPSNISSQGIKNLQLLAYTELIEIAFFTDLITNVSTSQPGFEIEDLEERVEILEGLSTVLAVRAVPIRDITS